MIIYVDENMPQVLAQGFNLLQKPENIKLKAKDPIEVISIIDEFGRGAEDEEWIPKAGKQGSCIITQDYNISRIKHQQKLCRQYQLGMFYFRPPSKSGFSYWDMVQLMVKHWPAICKIATKEKKPFAYRITSRSSKPERM